MRKRRSDGRINSGLSVTQRHELYRLLTEGAKSDEWAVDFLLAEYSIKLSRSAVAKWRESWKPTFDQYQRLAVVSAAQKTRDELVEHLPMLNEATVAMLHQASYAAMASGDTDDIKALVSLLLQYKKQEQAEDKLALDRERYEDAQRRIEAAEKAKEEIQNNEDLSVLEQANIMRESLGLPLLDEEPG